jgi:hypothetical protein
MMYRGGHGCGGKRKKKRAKACERRETKKRSTKRHFGITSGKRGAGNTPARNTCVLLVGRNDEQLGPKLKPFQIAGRVKTGET